MGKRGERRKRKGLSDVDPGLLAAYLEDPITLWQDGEYEALNAFYAREDWDALAPVVHQAKPGMPESDDRDIPF